MEGTASREDIWSPALDAFGDNAPIPYVVAVGDPETDQLQLPPCNVSPEATRQSVDTLRHLGFTFAVLRSGSVTKGFNLRTGTLFTRS